MGKRSYGDPASKAGNTNSESQAKFTDSSQFYQGNSGDTQSPYQNPYGQNFNAYPSNNMQQGYSQPQYNQPQSFVGNPQYNQPQNPYINQQSTSQSTFQGNSYPGLANPIPPDKPKKGMPTGAVIGIIAGIAVIIGVVLFFLLSSFFTLKNGYTSEDELYEHIFTSISNDDSDGLKKCFADESRLNPDDKKSLYAVIDEFCSKDLDLKFDISTIKVISSNDIDLDEAKEDFGIKVKGAKEVNLLIEFDQKLAGVDEPYRCSEEFNLRIGKQKDKWIVFELNADQNSVKILNTGETPETSTETTTEATTDADTPTTSGTSEFASYELDESNMSIKITPHPENMTDDTFIPGINVKYKDMVTECHNILEEGNTFDDNLFKNFVCVMLYDDTAFSKTTVQESVAMAAAFANEFSDANMTLNYAVFDMSSQDIVIKLHTTVAGTENIIWLAQDGDNVSVKLNDGQTDYNSTMFDADALAVWYMAIEDVMKGNIYDPSESETTEATSESTTEETTESETNISGDWINFDDMSFSMNGTTFTLGKSTMQDIIDSGIEINTRKSIDDTVEPNTSFGGFNVKFGGDDRIGYFDVFNDTDSPKKAKDCILYYVDCDFEDDPITFSFPSAMTLDELVAKYGEPDHEYHNDDDPDRVYDYYTYNKASDKYYGYKKYEFRFCNQKLDSVTLSYK